MRKAIFKNGIKLEIVKAYLEEFRNYPSKTIARIIAKRHPMIFDGIEDARDKVRYLRGNYGETARKMAKDKRFFRSNKKPGNYFPEIPPALSQYEEEWKITNIDIEKALVLYDLHIPFQDKKAVERAVQYGLESNCLDLIIAGDFLDCFSISNFLRDITLISYKEELEIGKNILKFLREKFSGNIYFKEGNHEERLESYLMLRAPDLLGIKNFSLKEILDLENMQIKYIKDKRPLKIDKLYIIHGHEFVYSSYNPVNPARGYFLRSKVITLGGHYHQTSEHTETSMDGQLITVWSTGCLCDLHPKYMPLNKWNHGFAVIDMTQKDRGFKVENYRIINDEVL